MTAQAQFALHHPNEALSSAIRAYELCVSNPAQTASAFTISALVLKCKRAKWEDRQKRRLHQRSELLRDLEEKLEQDAKREVEELHARRDAGEVGEVEMKEERDWIERGLREKVEELRSVFEIARPEEMETREVPEYLVDQISFEIMHDP